jgi:TolA-binding protein
MENWFDRKTLLMGCAALVSMGVGTYFYQSFVEKKEEEGRSALYRVQKVYEEERNSVPESERSAGSSLDVDSKFSKTTTELAQILNQKKIGERGLFEAAHRLGVLYLEHRQAEKAVSAIQQGVGFARSEIQKASLQFLLGAALEQTGKFEEALLAFQNGLSQNVDAMKPEFMLGIMRMQIQKKDLSQAKKTSEQIAKDLPGSKAVEVAKQLLKESS